MVLSTSADPDVAPYAALARAQRQWQQEQGNPAVIMEIVAALLRLGLGGIAERFLIQAQSDAPEWGMQRDVWLERVHRCPSGRVSWASRRRRFQANLASLAGHNVGELSSFWDTEAARYELYLASDGNPFALDLQIPNVPGGILGGLMDHRSASAAYALPQADSPLVMPFAFDGAGYGWFLLRVLELSHESHLQYSCPVYLVEPDRAAFCMLLHVQDLRSWFAGPRLRLFIGEQAAENFRNALCQRDDWTLPKWMVCNHLSGRAPLPMDQITCDAGARRGTERARLRTAIDAWYADKTPAYWARRFADATNGGRPLKVMGVTTRFSTVLQYSMREFAEAVRAAGHEFILSIESDDQSLEQPQLRMLHDHKPDLLVSISRMRHESADLPANVPALCWDQDGLSCMRTESATRSVGPLTYVAGHGAYHGFLNLGWPEDSCIFFRAAGSTHRYSNARVDPEVQTQVCDFSYVSNASGTPEFLLAEQVKGWNTTAVFRDFIEKTGQNIIARSRTGYAWDAYRLDQFVRAQEKTAGIHVLPHVHFELVAQLRRISDRAFRHVALGWVADYCQRHGTTLRLVGRGWKAHPVFGQFAEDFIAPGEELKALYQSTKINLQIIESGFIHSRVLDGIAAGGFFLTRLAPEARDHNGTGRLVHAMARRARETGLQTNAQLRDSGDPVVQRGWEVMDRTMKREELRPEMPCRYLRQWAASPTEEVAFPRLNEVTFMDQASFDTLAARYLNDAEARGAIVDDMRKIVVESFSYNACWRESLATICRGLQKIAGLAS